jgi:acyl-CoA thioesterase
MGAAAVVGVGTVVAAVTCVVAGVVAGGGSAVRVVAPGGSIASGEDAAAGLWLGGAAVAAGSVGADSGLDVDGAAQAPSSSPATTAAAAGRWRVVMSGWSRRGIHLELNRARSSALRPPRFVLDLSTSTTSRVPTRPSSQVGRERIGALDGSYAPEMRSGTEMYDDDAAARAFGMSILDVAPGVATVEMTVTEQMTNGLDVCHGGVIFTLADTAMAYASNAGDHWAFSTTATIEWLRPAHLGDVLTATSSTVARRGRNTIHDVVVTAADGETIALVRAHTLTMEGGATMEGEGPMEAGGTIDAAGA